MPGAASAQTRTLRIVTYNIEADTGGYATNRPGLINPWSGGTATNGGVLEGIGEEVLGSDGAQPIDILALQETTSNTTTVTPIVNGLNSYYNVVGMYALSPFQATSSGGVTGGGGPSALIYNTTAVQLLASVGVDPPGGTNQLGSPSGEYREVIRYLFAPAGVATNSANIFYIYNSHYKASTGITNEMYRAEEAQIIRNDSATLPSNSRILYVGDYNPTGGSSEQGYQTIIGPGINQGIDPLNPPGATGIDWSGNSLQVEKTESAVSLRYRDDFQISTTNIYYGVAGGLTLVSGTYHAFGNNGTTAYSGNVGTGNTALTNIPVGARVDAVTLYADLTNASDHLPVVADYIVPLYVAPVASFTGTPSNGIAQLLVSFTNTSTSATNYSWIFGDGGTSSLTNVSHTYTNPGTYTVSLQAVGPGGTNTLTRTSYIVVTSPPPVVSFSGTPTNGAAPLMVTFTNSSTGATNYSWVFGDFTTDSVANPSHTYTNPGTYTVLLQASGPGGTRSLSRPGYIVATSPPPVAGFTGTPTNGAAPLMVTFTNLSTGATNYSWTFGDGGVSHLTNVSYAYTNPGTFTVTLQAIGPGGSDTLMRTSYIVVTPPPSSGIILANLSLSDTNGFQFCITNADGSPVTSDEQPRISIYASDDPGLPFSNWTVLPISTILTNGLLQASDTNSANFPSRFYRAVEAQ
jgi:PKD repeat protein